MGAVMRVSEMAVAPEGRQGPLSWSPGLSLPYPHPDALGAWWFNHSPVPLGQQLGAEGLGAALAINPPEGWQWVVVGDDAVLRGSSHRVFYSPRAAEGCPPKVSPADASLWSGTGQRFSAARRRDPINAAIALQSEAPGLEGKRLDCGEA